ncbi:hypothetical protein B2J88_20295 [Rhodococcus sp. SRB_17]|uniref:hypothetical protein n=1 Tax=Acidovorax sp. SRB_24 TaxID=1962700 RepID=UPI00145C8A0C|nr:hypothetical protein [Acidovorax sp. SRB_24]NMM75392.1 hypothetical protein [Acidovorax sp. SRB_24]NMM86679.1 hypothetical protein [Rhodococcus sp. SRB_17]
MASPVDTSVKFFREDFPGAPVLNGVAGSLLSLLDACLCTGFGLRSATSLVVTGGVATLVLASDAKNPNLLNSVVLVSGVTGALTALNGEQRVTFASPTEIKFATAAADGTATGSITVKTAPAGWEKKFPGTNTAGFKSLDVTSRGAHLWINDTGTINANVRAYENMTGVDAGTGPAPTVAESAAGGFWAKSEAASANAARWNVFADGRALYYCPVIGSVGQTVRVGQGAYFFGEPTAYKSGDAFATVIFSAASAPGQSAAPGSVFNANQSGAATRWLRSYTGLGGAVSAFAPPVCGSPTTYSGLDGTLGRFPLPTDGGLRFSNILLMEGALSGDASVLRGVLPGVYHVPQSNLNASFAPGDRVTLAGRHFYAVCADSVFNVNTPGGGRGFFDITGPWR